MSRPIRMCLGCRGRGDKSELIRVVCVSGRVEVDLEQIQLGRGAYLHPRPVCVEKALTKKVFGRALRNEVDSTQVSTSIRTVLGGVT